MKVAPTIDSAREGRQEVPTKDVVKKKKKGALLLKRG